MSERAKEKETNESKGDQASKNDDMKARNTVSDTKLAWFDRFTSSRRHIYVLCLIVIKCERPSLNFFSSSPYASSSLTVACSLSLSLYLVLSLAALCMLLDVDGQIQWMLHKSDTETMVVRTHSEKYYRQWNRFRALSSQSIKSE